MTTLITGTFAKILEAERNTFNHKFAEARHVHPSLDPSVFGDHLRTAVAPVVAAVEQQRPEQVSEVVHTLYDLSLDLLGQGFLGPNSRYPFVVQGWIELLPRLAQHIAASPQRAIGAITNALYNLSVTMGARPHEWLQSMIGLAAMTPDLDALLQAGQVAAWRAGLAHYRRDALDLCARLDPALARAALGLPASSDVSNVETIVARLSADPWLDPRAVQERPGNKQLKLVARAGSFRGLGGLFLSTPTVAAAGEHFVVRDGESGWLLVADVFGATWHRADGATGASQTLPFSLAPNGHVTRERYSQTFPELAKWNSAAANSTTLAVTTPLSFAVHLIALAET